MRRLQKQWETVTVHTSIGEADQTQWATFCRECNRFCLVAFSKFGFTVTIYSDLKFYPIEELACRLHFFHCRAQGTCMRDIV